MEKKVPTKIERAERPNMEGSLRRFAGHLTGAVVSLIQIPLSILPDDSRHHLEKATREAVRGTSALVRSVAKGLDQTLEKDEE